MEYVIRNYKYKLYISKNTKKLSELITSSNFVWNKIVRLTRRYYKMFHKSVSKYRLQKQVTKWMKHNEYWCKFDAQSMQAISHKYSDALDNVFKLKRGFPKTKKCYDIGSIKFNKQGYKLFDDGRLIINKISKTKPFKFKVTRMYGEVRTITIKRDRLNCLWLIVCCRVPKEHIERLCNGSIGMDFGLKTFLTTSQGEVINIPNFVNDSFKEISKCCKDISHKYEAKVYGSSFKRSKKRLLKAYQKLTNKRDDYYWKLAHTLCRENSLIAIEDLNIKGMSSRTMKDKLKHGRKRFGKKISMLSPSSFNQKLEVVADKYDTLIYRIDRWFPSSQLCSICGYQNKETKNLNIRKWICPNCHTQHNRDVNASINILNEALNNILGKGISLDGSDSKTNNFQELKAVTVTI